MNTATNSGGGRTRWSLRLLGGFELRLLPGGERSALPGKRERLLLAYLGLSPNHRQSRRKLAALLWGDAADETTLDNLRTCMWRLRKALDDTEHRLISSEGEDIVLNIGAFDIDVLAFRRFAAETGRGELEGAANLYAGEFLDGFEIESEEFEHWRRTEATRCRDLAIEALTRLMMLLDKNGETERATETGLKILGLDPLHEAAVRGIMRLYGRSGRRGAGIQLYQSLVNTLKAELDSEPEAETKRVFLEVSRAREDETDSPNDANAELSSDPSILVRPSREPGRLPRPMMAPSFWSRAGLAALAGVLLVVAAFLFQPWSTLLDQPVVSESAASVPPTQAISVAVLPFANLSGDASQEFFSDGMTEEITAALAKIPSLRVVARSSAFQFKGQNEDVRKVAQSLGATHLLEGAVRREDSHIRISVQLVQADNGVNVWTETFDRQLAGVFALQEEIARSIAISLRVPLGLGPDQNLVNNRNIDPESYQLYLHAKALWEARGLANLTDSERIFERVVERNPHFAPAWAFLCANYFLIGQARIDDESPMENVRRTVGEFVQKAKSACQQAIALDPTFSLGYGASGTMLWSTGRPLEGEELFLKALALDPNDANSLQGYGFRLAVAGRLKDALAMELKANALEPFGAPQGVAYFLWLNGRNEEAIAFAKNLRPVDRAPALATIYASMGRFGEAADALAEVSSGFPDSNLVRESIRLLRAAPTQVPQDDLPRFPVTLDFVYLYTGSPERVLDNFERKVEAGYVGGTQVGFIWHPSYAAARKSERFKRLMRKAGYVDYWRERGWPDRCRPMGADDFNCD